MRTRPKLGPDEIRGAATPERGGPLEAARRLALQGEWARAAESYERGGAALKAAEAWERAGEHKRAAEAYERLFADSLVTSASAAHVDKSAALRAGQLYARAGLADKALEVLGRGGHRAAAAELAESLGRFADAAELYARAESLTRAAECWERAGDRVRAALMRGEIDLRADRVAEAAGHFLEGQDYYRAAEIYESVGQPAQAAAAYEAGGAFAEASEAYLRAGERRSAAAALEKTTQLGRAAELWEGLGERERAAALFEQAGEHFKSGRAAAEAGDVKKAIALLQRVAPADESYLEATDLLAQLFLRSGLPRLALERLQLVLGEQPLATATLGLHYGLAACHEALGDKPAALDLYQKILALDFAFRDTAERASRLTGGVAPEDVSPAPAAPPAAAPASASDVSAVPPDALPAPPAQGPLVLREELGRGPLGVVQRAEEPGDGRSVAVRVLEGGGVTPPALVSALAGLAPAAALSHPNLVKLLGVLQLDGRTCIVSELVKGTNMADFLRSGQRLSLKRCHALGRALALVLSFVHGKGLVHGSVRPSNLMVVAGILKLADVGLGPLFRLVVPRDAYRAPENQLDVAGDVFSFGATLYHLLTGTLPPMAPAPVPPPSEIAEGVPVSFDQLLLRALNADPEERFHSAKEIVQALDAMVTIG